jgi:hypothetical protein
MLVSSGTCADIGYYAIRSRTECRDAAESLGLDSAGPFVANSAVNPTGCYYRSESPSKKLWFNSNGLDNAASSGRQLICSKTQVDVWTAHSNMGLNGQGDVETVISADIDAIKDFVEAGCYSGFSFRDGNAAVKKFSYQLAAADLKPIVPHGRHNDTFYLYTPSSECQGVCAADIWNIDNCALHKALGHCNKPRFGCWGF